MRKLSRWMPKQPPQRIIPTSSFLLVLVAALLLTFFFSSTAFWVILGLILFGAVMDMRYRRRLRRLAEQRVGESICTFARVFNRREVDPWIIRAVYERLHDEISTFSISLPIRAEDRIDADLGIDSEDLDDLIIDIALQTGRSVKNTEPNPFYGKIRSVGDLVLFLTYQPKGSAV